MPGLLTPAISRSRRREERGAVAILVALVLTGLLVVGAMVLDFGLVRVDRQVNKSAADAATLAGLQGLSGGSNKAHPFTGVCTALRYLRANDARFASISSAAPNAWTDGTTPGAPKANGCEDAALKAWTCKPGDRTSWARFTWTGVWQGHPIRVVIQSGYDLTDGGWSEEQLEAVAADNVDSAQGCDQLAVIVTQNRKPSLGSLATSSDLVSSIRSVGRLTMGPGSDAPAMLLLKRTGCPILQSGSNSGVSFIHVLGALSTNNVATPGSIHADSDGAGGCTGGSNQNIFLGKGSNGIVAYAAPLVTNPAVADPAKPGLLTSVAGEQGKAPNFIRDLLANAHGSKALNASGDTAATAMEPAARSLVTREPVDARYLSGVRTAITGASTTVFNTLTAANAADAANGYTVVNNCNPATLPDVSVTKLFINCTDNAGYKGTQTINARYVVFNGKVAPSGDLRLPYAHHVYIFGSSSDAMLLGGSGEKFRMHTDGNTDPLTGRCSEARTSSKAVLFIKNGDIKESNGSNLLQLCNTTVFMMGGQADGCLPSYTPGDAEDPSAPSPTPCAGNTPGTGQFTMTGGDVDWTAPDEHDVMTLTNGDPDPLLAPAWSDPNGPEDLALWSESGVTASLTYNMNGSGVFHVRGVYMVPNADPFTIGGGGSQNLTNAQYVASSIALNGTNTNITMKVDPNAAVTLPRLHVVGLVR